MIFIVSHTNKEQRMKQKIGRILMGIAIVLAVYAYAHISKTHNVYDKDIDASEYKDTTVYLNEEITQTFICQEDYLDGIRVKCRLAGGASEVRLRWSLTDLKENTQVAKGTADGSQVKSGKFFEIPFQRVQDTRGKEYEFRIAAEGEDTESSVNFCYTAKQEENTAMELNGSAVEGTVVLRTVTERFDLETFCVLLIFVLYSAAFLRFLYKLFK